MARSLSGWVIRSTGWPGDQEKKRVLCKKREEGIEDFTLHILENQTLIERQLQKEILSG